MESKGRPNGPEVGRIIGNGTPVKVVCEAHGPTVDGQSHTVWDRIEDGTWVYGYYLTTPSTPA